MPAVVLLNDPSDHGGKMVTATGNVLVNGIMICVDQDIHSCPKQGHGNTHVTATGDGLSNNKKIIVVGDKAGCGAKITQGSSNVGNGQ